MDRRRLLCLDVHRVGKKTTSPAGRHRRIGERNRRAQKRHLLQLFMPPKYWGRKPAKGPRWEIIHTDCRDVVGRNSSTGSGAKGQLVFQQRSRLRAPDDLPHRSRRMENGPRVISPQVPLYSEAQARRDDFPRFKPAAPSSLASALRLTVAKTRRHH